jgi:predicted transcriptional regulator
MTWREMSQGKLTVTDAQIIEFVAGHDDPVVAAIEVADWFGHSRQWAHNRLEALHSEGQIEKKKAGSSSVIWYLD